MILLLIASVNQLITHKNLVAQNLDFAGAK
jgi:hypothetical protein